MTEVHFLIPDDEVDAVTFRRMGNALYVVTLAHRFGFAYDAHGQVLDPAPHGVGSATEPSAAWAAALADLRDEVAKKIAANNARESSVGKYPALTRSSVSLDLDLEL